MRKSNVRTHANVACAKVLVLLVPRRREFAQPQPPTRSARPQHVHLQATQRSPYFVEGRVQAQC